MFLWSIVFLSILTDRTLASDCAPSPLSIAIGNVTLSDQKVARGVEISVGSPAQAFAFLPQWPMNNSFVYGTDGRCGGTSSAECTTFRGGAYDIFSSSTRKVADSDAYPVDTSPWSEASYVTDTMILTDNLSLDNFPLGVPLNDLGQQGYHPMNAIGLGDNSTLLNALMSSGKIASRTWSMFWGRNGASKSSQMEGIFVLGGYDKAKIQKQKYTQALSDSNSACQTRMVVTITDMILNFSNGTNASIFPQAASSAIQACIVPDYPVLMTIPLDPYFSNFEELTNQTLPDRSFGLVYFANRYGADDTVYTGDLTFKFQSGLSVRIPNDQLIVPDRYIDDSGVIIANSTGPDITLLSIQDVNANDISQLGRQFLSSAYVMLNQDANEFTLWEANPTSDTELVAVDTTNADVTTFCDPNAATGSATGTGSSSSSSSAAADDGGSSLSGGAIAGIAVGAVAVIAIVAGALFFWWRKRRQAAAAAAARQPAYGGPMDQNYAAQHGNNMYGGVSQNPDTPNTHSYYKTELQGSEGHPPSELQASLMGSPVPSPQPVGQGPPRQHYELQG